MLFGFTPLLFCGLPDSQEPIDRTILFADQSGEVLFGRAKFLVKVTEPEEEVERLKAEAREPRTSS